MKIEECEECWIKKDDVEEMLVQKSVSNTNEFEDVYEFLCHDCYDWICDENG